MQEKKDLKSVTEITQAMSKVTKKIFKIKKANGKTKNYNKENDHLPSQQSNINFTTENCKQHDLSETSPSSMTMPTPYSLENLTQKKEADIKSATQAKSKVTRMTFKKANDNTKNDKENEHLPDKQSNENFATKNVISKALSGDYFIEACDIFQLEKISKKIVDEIVNVYRVKKYFSADGWNTMSNLLKKIENEVGWYCKTC